MGGNACCISRSPPSPDALQIRQINCVSEDLKESNKALMLSCSSQFSKTEDAADLQAIFKGNSQGLENDYVSKRRGASRSKLRKRFSRESTLMNGRTRSTVGNSEEEIARREELKRIRNKRIREELGDLSIYDEDATPLCSSPFRPASKNAIDTFNEDSQDEPINDIINAYSRHSFESDNKQSSQLRKETNVKPRISNVVPGGMGIPLAPILKPKNMPSIDDAAIRRTSWRLSFSSDQRASCLRALNQSNHQDESKGYANLVVLSAESLYPADGQKKWLGSQVRRSPLQTVVDGHWQHVDRISQYDANIKPLNFERVNDNTEVTVAAVPLHEMQISRRLASRGTYISPTSKQLFKCQDSGYDEERASSEEGFQEINMRRSRYFRNTSSTSLNENKTSTTWDQILDDRTSSPYKLESDDSLVPTHESLRSQGPAMIVSQRPDTMARNLQVPCGVTVSDISDASGLLKKKYEWRVSGSNTPRTNESITKSLLFIAPDHEDTKEYEQDIDYPTTWSSYGTNQYRPTTPINSKFMESFDEPSSESSIRSSLLSVIGLSGLGRLRTRSYDRENSIESNCFRELQTTQQKARPVTAEAPTRITSRNELLSMNRRQGSSVESAETMWTKAIRQTINRGSQDIKQQFEAIRPGSKSQAKKFDETPKKENKTSIEQLTEEAEVSKYLSRSTQSSHVTPLESWDKYPSYNGKRRESTGPINGVNLSDVAVKELLDGLYEDATGTRKPNLRHQEGYRFQSLPEQVAMKVQTSFDRLFTKKSAKPSDVVYGYSNSADGTSGNLEIKTLPYDHQRETSQRELRSKAGIPMNPEVAEAPKVLLQRSIDGPHEGLGIEVGNRQLCENCINEKSLRSEATLDIVRLRPEASEKEASMKRRDKYKTWSGHEQNHIANMMSLRQSTVDFTLEVEIMKKVERERALRAADEALAWSMG